MFFSRRDRNRREASPIGHCCSEMNSPASTKPSRAAVLSAAVVSKSSAHRHQQADDRNSSSRRYCCTKLSKALRERDAPASASCLESCDRCRIGDPALEDRSPRKAQNTPRESAGFGRMSDSRDEGIQGGTDSGTEKRSDSACFETLRCVT